MYLLSMHESMHRKYVLELNPIAAIQPTKVSRRKIKAKKKKRKILR